MRSRRSDKQHLLLLLTLGGAAIIASGALTGCQDVLFPKNAPRTQFTNYDRMRNVYAPEKELDPLGREVPNLRGRLAPQ